MVWVFLFKSDQVGDDKQYKARVTDTEEAMIRVVEKLIDDKKWWVQYLPFHGDFSVFGPNTSFWYETNGVFHWMRQEFKHVQVPESGQILVLFMLDDFEKVYRSSFLAFESVEKLEGWLQGKVCASREQLLQAAQEGKEKTFGFHDNSLDIFYEDGGHLFKPIDVSGYSLTKSANKT